MEGKCHYPFTTEERKIDASILYQDIDSAWWIFETLLTLNFSFRFSYKEKVGDGLRIKELSCGPWGSLTIFMKMNGTLPLIVFSLRTSEIHLQ